MALFNPPSAALPPRDLECNVLGNEPLSLDVSRIRLAVPAGCTWHAGQYLLLMLEDASAFSIASAAGGNELELHVRHGDDNPSSQKVMQALNVGSKVRVQLPHGERFVSQAPDKPLWLVCGSTGYAPARAMLEHLQGLKHTGEVRLYWGARTRADLYLDEEAAAFAASLPGMQYIPALSDEQRDGVFHGMVHEKVIADLACCKNPAEVIFYIGGSPAMGWAVFDALVAAGVPAEHVHSDVFDYAPR